MISTNPGEPMRQLEHIASGGELSRVMLALKASVDAGNLPAERPRSAIRMEKGGKIGSPEDFDLRRNRYRYRGPSG